MAGNANSGRQPKEKSFANMLRIALAENESLRAIADKLVQQAIAGEGWAIKEVADRLDGKPAQAIIGGDEDDAPLKVTVVIGGNGNSGN